MYGKAIGKKKLEDDFIAELKKRTPKAKFLAIFKATVLDLWEEKGKDFRMDAQKYERQIAVLEGKRKRIFEMREDGSYTRKNFKNAKKKLKMKSWQRKYP